MTTLYLIIKHLRGVIKCTLINKCFRFRIKVCYHTKLYFIVILEPKKSKSVTVFIVSPSICHDAVEKCMLIICASRLKPYLQHSLYWYFSPVLRSKFPITQCPYQATTCLTDISRIRTTAARPFATPWKPTRLYPSSVRVCTGCR